MRIFWVNNKRGIRTLSSSDIESTSDHTEVKSSTAPPLASTVDGDCPAVCAPAFVDNEHNKWQRGWQRGW